jgi:hypothetical protein
MEDLIVSHYGLHWDRDNIAFLMQGRGGTNAIGSKARAPFEVRPLGRSRHCNHQIPLASPVPNDYHWDYFLQFLDDPLVQAMLPIPKQGSGMYYIEAGHPRLLENLVLLSKLSSPIHSVVQPMWNLKPQVIMSEIEMTNVQPFVVVECTAKDSPVIGQLVKAGAYKPRTVVLAGATDVVLPPVVQRISTRLTDDIFSRNDMLALPWESLGAVVVRKFMRGEWPPQTNPVRGLNDPKAKSPRGSYFKT